MSILENFSKMQLASAIAERQGVAAYLRVLALALRNFGAPEAIVMDSGGGFYSSKAPTLDKVKKARRNFIRDCNCQIHFAHRERQDNLHSPHGAPARIFFATEFTHHLDRSGYIRVHLWRFYAESKLAKQEVQVNFYTGTLKIEYQEKELAFYTIEWEDNKRVKEVKNPRLIETSYGRRGSTCGHLALMNGSFF